MGEELILKKLDLLGVQMNAIMENIQDLTLTADDIHHLEIVEKEFEQGKTRRL